MTYDDWKTTDTSAEDYCSNGHYHCPPCPVGPPHPCCECDHQGDDMDPDREICDFCGRAIATAEDGEMQATDPRCALLCWSDERQAKFCDKDPKRPDAPHRRDCPCGDCYVDQD